MSSGSCEDYTPVAEEQVRKAEGEQNWEIWKEKERFV